jgi:Mn2+/Fe2+ NRAMP family transporter
MQVVKRLYSQIVGPAAVMAAGTMGAGAATSLILAGAWFRYDLLWIIPLILPLFVISVDSASRIGLLNPGTGMFSQIREHLHPGVAWLIFAINIPVHLLIGMGQMSVMTSALMSSFGFYPPEIGATSDYATNYHYAEILLSLSTGALIIWMLSSGGYQRMQKVMSALMIVLFLGFFVVALSSWREIGDILAGFIPNIPGDLPVPGTETTRSSTGSIIAIVGSALAPAALLGIPYMCADNLRGPPNLRAEFRSSVINLGLIFGGYSIFVIVAGGYALYPQADNATIDTVHEAGKVLVNIFPRGLDFLGPLIFSVGLMIAALTTFIVVVQVICYFWLDMFGRNWHDVEDNPSFRRLLIVWVALPAILAPFWSFPALLKVLLLMGFNAIVIPLVIIIVLVLVNKSQLMGEHKASIPRNLVLLAALALSVWLMVEKLPDYITMITG